MQVVKKQPTPSSDYETRVLNNIFVMRFRWLQGRLGAVEVLTKSLGLVVQDQACGIIPDLTGRILNHLRSAYSHLEILHVQTDVWHRRINKRELAVSMKSEVQSETLKDHSGKVL